MLHVGQLVLCVNDKILPRHARIARALGIKFSGLKRGRVYTIRWIGRGSWCGETFDGVRLDELVRANGDSPFSAERFVPLDDTKLEVFRNALKDLPLHVGEDA